MFPAMYTGMFECIRCHVNMNEIRQQLLKWEIAYQTYAREAYLNAKSVLHSK